MDQTVFQRWWDMHVRVAKGVSLNPEEQAFYDSGREELQRDEQLQDVPRMREDREKLQALEAEREQLESRRRKLEREIADLEKRLPEHTRELLGAEE